MGPIVVATDLSPTSDAALAAAVVLARASGVTLHLVHAWQPAAVYTLDAALIESPESVARLMTDRQRRLDALLARHEEPGLSMKGHLVEGDVATEVSRYAKGIGAALIAMGTSAPTGLRHVLLGSSADAITRAAPCPVLVVRVGVPVQTA